MPTPIFFFFLEEAFDTVKIRCIIWIPKEKLFYYHCDID